MIDIANDLRPNSRNCSGIGFGNKHEGSIPFTRSIHNQILMNVCSKSAVKQAAKKPTKDL